MPDVDLVSEDQLRQAARFRRYASQCVELAREMEPPDKARLLHLAEAWRRRAEALEKPKEGAVDQK